MAVVVHASVPDVWSNAVDNNEFEDSFFESLCYEFSKFHSAKKKTKLIPKYAFKNLCDIDADTEMLTSDLEYIKKMILRWLVNKPKCNPFVNDWEE